MSKYRVTESSFPNYPDTLACGIFRTKAAYCGHRHIHALDISPALEVSPYHSMSEQFIDTFNTNSAIFGSDQSYTIVDLCTRPCVYGSVCNAERDLIEDNPFTFR